MADSDKIKQDTKEAAKSAEDLKDNFADAAKSTGDLKDNFAEVVDLTDQLSGAMMGFLQALGNSNIGLNLAKKSARSLLKNQQTLEEVQMSLTKLSSKELKTLAASSKREIDRLRKAAEFVEKKKERGEALTTQEEELLAAKKQNFAIEEASVAALEEQAKARAIIEGRLGLTGIALDNLGRIGIRALGGIGVNLGALQGDFDAVTDKVEDLAEAGESKFKIFGAAVAATGPIIRKSLTDPAALSAIYLDRLTKAFVELQKDSVEFGRLTGQNATIASSLNTRFATTAEILKTATALTKELGINASNAFSRDVIAAAAEIQNEIGLSVEEASKLAVITQTTSGDFDAITESIVDSVSAFNRSNRAAVSQGVVLRDVANVSEDILVSFKNQTGALAEAAAAARKLGLDLSTIDKIADSLLDFESSISNELEAQLLTGRELNLDKAREFALTNNLKGLSDELLKNSIDINEFGSMTRIAQDGLAKALGLQRHELAKIALQQKVNLGLTDLQLEAAAGVTAEDLKRVEVQQQLQRSIQKISQALVGPLELLAQMANSTLMLSSTFGLLVASQIPKFLKLLDLSIVRMTILVGLENSRAISAISTAIASSAGLATLTVIGGIAAAVGAYRALTKVDDGVIGPDGGLVVSGPKGSYQLNSGDTVVAGTNLGGTPQWAERLIAAVERGGDVYIDGNKAGTAMALGSYKL